MPITHIDLSFDMQRSAGTYAFALDTLLLT